MVILLITVFVFAKIKRLYNSELCGDWLLSQSTATETLKGICTAAVQSTSTPGTDADGRFVSPHGGPWTKTDFDTDMGQLCKCYYPDAYYRWFKETHLPQDEGTQTNVQLFTRIECFHEECARSGYYDHVGNTECPSIQTCIQSIENNTNYLGSPSDRMMGTRDIGVADSQTCNFSALQVGATPGGTGGGTGTGTGTGGGTGDGTGTGGNPYPYPYPYPYPPPPPTATHRSEGTSSRIKDDDSTMIIGGVVLMCCGFMMMMVMMSMGKKSN